MSNVLLSSSVRASLFSLQQTNDLLNTTQNRLATGKKVSSANDNPAVFFTASALSTRANDLNVVLNSITAATKAVSSTNESISSLTNLLTSAQNAARSAQASAATTARTTGSVSNLTGASSFAVTSARTITVNDGTTTATITSTGAVTVQQVIDGINNAASLKVKASLTADGKLQLEATQNNAITIGGTATAPELVQYGLVSGTTAAATTSSTRSSFAAQYDAIRGQIDQLSKDANFNGTNLLANGSLRIYLNENSTSSLVVNGYNDTASGLGIAASTNGFQTDKDIGDALNNLTAGLNSLKAQSILLSSSGDVLATRAEFTKRLISTLNAASDDLVAADTNEEGANLLALQTRQSLSSTALSLASQADQSALRLFR